MRVCKWTYFTIFAPLAHCNLVLFIAVNVVVMAWRYNAGLSPLRTSNNMLSLPANDMEHHSAQKKKKFDANWFSFVVFLLCLLCLMRVIFICVIGHLPCMK